VLSGGRRLARLARPCQADPHAEASARRPVFCVGLARSACLAGAGPIGPLGMEGMGNRVSAEVQAPAAHGEEVLLEEVR
jgi:hypothetical protein